jgi:hypothetical protein
MTRIVKWPRWLSWSFNGLILIIDPIFGSVLFLFHMEPGYIIKRLQLETRMPASNPDPLLDDGAVYHESRLNKFCFGANSLLIGALIALFAWKHDWLFAQELWLSYVVVCAFLLVVSPVIKLPLYWISLRETPATRREVFSATLASQMILVAGLLIIPLAFALWWKPFYWDR